MSPYKSTFLGNNLAVTGKRLIKLCYYLPESGESLFEFLNVELLVSVVIALSENDFEGVDTVTSSALTDLVFKVELEFLYSNIEIDSVECHSIYFKI
jgi:hypothetical protein